MAATLDALLRGVEGVGDTALLTMACRALETRRSGGTLSDAVACAQMDRVGPLLVTSPVRLHRRIAAGRISDSLVAYVALRARRFDAWARDFALRNPDGTVVALGCGLDDRLRRIGHERMHMVSVDLPAMTALRRALVEPHEREHLASASAIDPAWMEAVRRRTEGPILVMAEGLLQYLDPRDVRKLTLAMDERLDPESLAVDVLHRRWLSPGLRWAVDRKMHRELGVPPEARVRFGMSSARLLEGMDSDWRVSEEWSHLDEPDVRPRALRLFRRADWIRRVQWSLLYRRRLSAAGDSPTDTRD
jgi:O-methyltransferase involved in polyketide biosynthesis